MQPVSLSLGKDAPGAALKKRVHEEAPKEVKQSLAEFSAGQRPEEEQAKKKAKKVIPCQPNNLLGGKKKEDPAAIGQLEDRFEAAAAQKEVSTEYGLVRPQAGAPGKPGAARTTTVSKDPGIDLAEEPTRDAYESMPVEDFGLALLRGMGMTEENKVETVQYVARPSRMGLGMDPSKMGTRLPSRQPTFGVAFLVAAGVDPSNLHAPLQSSADVLSPARHTPVWQPARPSGAVQRASVADRPGRCTEVF